MLSAFCVLRALFNIVSAPKTELTVRLSYRLFDFRELKILYFEQKSSVLYTSIKGFVRAGMHAVAAAYALTAVGVHRRIDIHLAGFCASIAAGTFTLVETHAVHGDPVEKTVDRA